MRGRNRPGGSPAPHDPTERVRIASLSVSVSDRCAALSFKPGAPGPVAEAATSTNTFMPKRHGLGTRARQEKEQRRDIVHPCARVAADIRPIWRRKERADAPGCRHAAFPGWCRSPRGRMRTPGRVENGPSSRLRDPWALARVSRQRRLHGRVQSVRRLLPCWRRVPARVGGTKTAAPLS